MPSISLELAARLDGPADVANSVLDLGQACFEFWVENPRALPMQDAVLTAFISYHRNAVNTLAVNLTYAEQRALEIGAEVLLMLADRVLQRRPADALTYHFRVAATTVEQTNNGAYQQAVAQLQRLEKALPADDAVRASFFERLNSLAREHKRKRNFIQLVDSHFPSSSS